jgi:hypothetical protein
VSQIHKFRRAIVLLSLPFFLLVFFTIITPIAMIYRFFGRDRLFLKKQFKDNYWVLKEPSLPNNFLDQ